MFIKSAYTRIKKQEEETDKKCEFYINYIIQKRNEIVKERREQVLRNN